MTCRDMGRVMTPVSRMTCYVRRMLIMNDPLRYGPLFNPTDPLVFLDFFFINNGKLDDYALILSAEGKS